MTRLNAMLLGALLVAVPLSLLAGRVWLDPLSDLPANALVIFADLRLPRAILAVTLGAGLGAAGAAMQGYLRNPLADPGLFGIAPGAALGRRPDLLDRLGGDRLGLARLCPGRSRSGHGAAGPDRRAHRVGHAVHPGRYDDAAWRER